MKPDVPTQPSVVAAIINYNRPALTNRALTSLVKSTSTSDGMIPVVIDNGSSPSEVSALQKVVGNTAELILLNENGGYAAACNEAIRLACRLRASAVWLLNNDIVIEPDALKSLTQTLTHEPRAAAVAPAMLSYSDPDVVLNAGASVDVWRGRIRPRYARSKRVDLPPKPFTTDSLEASAILIRTAALRDVGRLDEGFFMYWEDAEWSYRARSAGWSLLVDPAAGVRHLESESSTPLSRTSFMLRNRWRFVRMCGSRAQIAVFTAYFLGLWIPAYLGARLVPEYGIRLALAAALRAIAWNLGDMIRNRAVRLSPALNKVETADDCS